MGHNTPKCKHYFYKFQIIFFEKNFFSFPQKTKFKEMLKFQYLSDLDPAEIYYAVSIVNMHRNRVGKCIILSVKQFALEHVFYNKPLFRIYNPIFTDTTLIIFFLLDNIIIAAVGSRSYLSNKIRSAFNTSDYVFLICN